MPAISGAWDPPVGRGRADRTGASLPYQSGASVATQLPGREVAVGPRLPASFPCKLDEALSIMVFSGALERIRGSPWSAAEAGVGWLLTFLSRMDMEWENLPGQDRRRPEHAPSRTFQGEQSSHSRPGGTGPPSTLHHRSDSCMWARDFPHTDSTFPESRRSIRGPWACSRTRIAGRSRPQLRQAHGLSMSGDVGVSDRRCARPRSNPALRPCQTHGHRCFYHSLGLPVEEHAAVVGCSWVIR